MVIPKFAQTFRCEFPTIHENKDLGIKLQIIAFYENVMHDISEMSDLERQMPPVTRNWKVAKIKESNVQTKYVFETAEHIYLS